MDVFGGIYWFCVGFFCLWWDLFFWLGCYVCDGVLCGGLFVVFYGFGNEDLFLKDCGFG